jgi:hypothetical protein
MRPRTRCSCYGSSVVAACALTVHSNRSRFAARLNSGISCLGGILSISIYYTAKRKVPLTSSEVASVIFVASRHSVDEQIEQLLATGCGINWESFDFCINSEPIGLFKKGTVFSGSTKLPDNREDATWVGVQHWCKCLSEIRLAIPECDWHVAVEDHELPWDPVAQAFDPSQ